MDIVMFNGMGPQYRSGKVASILASRSKRMAWTKPLRELNRHFVVEFHINDPPA